MKQALVTGGCGFVGRHVVNRLLEEETSVWVVDDLSTGRHPGDWLPAGAQPLSGSGTVMGYRYPDSTTVTFVDADVRSFLRDSLDPQAPVWVAAGGAPPRFGQVFHFAAVVGGRAKIEGDPMAVAVDLAIDAEFFAWAVRARPERILYASSSAAYPVDLQTAEGAVALKEEMVLLEGRIGSPDMTYGWSKLTGEYLARIAAAHYGLSVAVVRPFSGYGEDQEEVYPVPAIAARAARREDPLVVWGSGRQGRDFIHIDDCVDGMMLALEKISDASAVNLGSGTLTSFLEAAALFAEIAGYSPQVRPLEDKPVGVHSRYADVTSSQRVLGWKPRISLREGFGRVYQRALARADAAHSRP